VILGDEDNRDWLRVTTNSSVTFKVNSATTSITFPSTFTTNEWQHVVVTRDAANNVAIYRNTDPVDTGMRSGTFYPEYIGLKAPNATTNYFRGYMADVGVWNQVLDDEQIGELFARGVDPVRSAMAFWTFDSDFSNSGTAGSALDGTPETSGTPFSVTNVPGERILGNGGLKLRGSSDKDYVQIGEDGLGDPVGLSLDAEMTIAAWLNPEALGYAGGTFLGGTNADWIRIEDARVYVRFGSTSNNWVPATTAFEADTWQHFMLTRDASDNVTLYRNLEEIASGTLGGTFEPLYIGLKAPEATTNYYRGLMDDFGIWDRVLSDTEMKTLFNRVPEPGGMTLLLCGVIAGLSWRRRRR